MFSDLPMPRLAMMLTGLTVLACTRGPNEGPVPSSAAPRASLRVPTESVAAQAKPEPAKGTEPPTLGSLKPIEITTDEQWVANDGFRGRAFLLINHHGTLADPDVPGGGVPDLDDTPADSDVPADTSPDLVEIISWLDGDRFDVHSDCCIHSSGALFFGSSDAGILLGSGDTIYGDFGEAPCQAPTDYYVPYWPSHPDFGPPRLKCRQEDCGYAYDQKTGTFTLRFEGSSIEIGRVRSYCMDADVHRVVVKDELGGRLRLEDMLQVSIIEQDADTDGRKELYVLSTLACSQWLKVIKVVPAD